MRASYIACAALLLIKAIKTWQQQHGGPPANAQERKAFKALLDSWQRKVNGIPTIEENFQVRLLYAQLAVAVTGLDTHSIKCFGMMNASRSLLNHA